jgi:hypothetical protein
MNAHIRIEHQMRIYMKFIHIQMSDMISYDV